MEQLCLAADALVTDYSSIMFAYALLDRPIVVHADNWPVYQASRGVYFDLLSAAPGDTPGAVSTTDDELVRVFRDGPFDDHRARELRATFRRRFCAFDDGRAAERVVRRVLLGDDTPLQTGAARRSHPRPPAPGAAAGGPSDRRRPGGRQSAVAPSHERVAGRGHVPVRTRRGCSTACHDRTSW
ncbi:CDP-glycerol glycerophosphotransferase family protein [Streptomyces sp. NPDC058691]|uniref:CDP-glycerol glycerophosphotransferase family protein n=1 Tax=Streptomyces sp. NPDC058691 TaxID=3346601 RepID=UPI003646B640